MQQQLLFRNHWLVLGAAADNCDDNLEHEFAGCVFRDKESFDYFYKEHGAPVNIFVAGAWNDVSFLVDYEFLHQVNVCLIKSLMDTPHLAIDELEKYTSKWRVVGLGQVPRNVHNVGVFFPELFLMPSEAIFRQLQQDHAFQELTDSNKPTSAFRKGIYITPVEEDQNGNPVFHLLRCSSNLNGPTDEASYTDCTIIDTVNDWARSYLETDPNLNHVLAQIYYNGNDNGSVTKKARIKKHADKTKDMPPNGAMAFCTFYQSLASTSNSNPVYRVGFDYLYGDKEEGASVLTKLRFQVKKDAPPELVPQFELTLYPNSVFLMPLSTNRYYTHEISPSILPADKVFTRMGYVVRSSNVRAVFDKKDGVTYILGKDGLPDKPLYKDPTEEEIAQLKELYFQENTTSEVIDYSVLKREFSLNQGDYLEPLRCRHAESNDDDDGDDDDN